MKGGINSLHTAQRATTVTFSNSFCGDNFGRNIIARKPGLTHTEDEMWFVTDIEFRTQISPYIKKSLSAVLFSASALPLDKLSDFFRTMSSFIFRKPENQSLPALISSLCQRWFIHFRLANKNAALRICWVVRPKPLPVKSFNMAAETCSSNKL